jgi:hypothetical protein
MRFYEIAAFFEVSAKDRDIAFRKNRHFRQIFGVDVIPMPMQHAGKYNVLKTSFPCRTQLAIDGKGLVPISILVITFVQQLCRPRGLLKLVNAIFHASMLPRQALANHARSRRASRKTDKFNLSLFSNRQIVQIIDEDKVMGKDNDLSF